MNKESGADGAWHTSVDARAAFRGDVTAGGPEPTTPSSRKREGWLVEHGGPVTALDAFSSRVSDADGLVILAAMPRAAIPPPPPAAVSRECRSLRSAVKNCRAGVSGLGRAGIKVCRSCTEETQTVADRSSGPRRRCRKRRVMVSDPADRGALDQGLAAGVRAAGAAGIPQYRSTAGLWNGFGARIRVILYNRTRRPREAPRTIEDMTKSRWRSRRHRNAFRTMSFRSLRCSEWATRRPATPPALKDNGAVIAPAIDGKTALDGRVDAGILDEDEPWPPCATENVAIVIPIRMADAMVPPLMPNVAL